MMQRVLLLMMQRVLLLMMQQVLLQPFLIAMMMTRAAAARLVQRVQMMEGGTR